MWTVINGIAYVSQVNDDIKYSAALSDPNSKCDFTLDDPTATIALRELMSVIVWDENAPKINGVVTTPGMSYIIFANWSAAAGTLSSIVTTSDIGIHNLKVQLAFSNNAIGSGYVSQQTLIDLVQPGVKYMLSGYLDQAVTVVNAVGFLQIDWLDTSGSVISSVSQTFTPTHPQARKNISGTAPANTVYAKIYVGGQTTSTTNSGTLSWATLQFEPMWFESQGISYPTADMNYDQVSCVLMPDGTISRKSRVFAGEIEILDRDYIGQQRFYTVQCRSLSFLLETLDLVNASYTDTQDTDIIADILSGSAYTGYLSIGQQNRFAPTSTVVDGVVVSSVTYTSNTLREVLNGLQDQSGSPFRVDEYGYIWYVPPGFSAQTIQLSDDPDDETTFAYQELHVSGDATNVANTDLVAGDKQHASAITETFSGDGSTKTFNLTYPPASTTSVTIGGTSQRTGVDGVDTLGATFKALINKQKKTLTFGTAPTSGTNNVSITYTYEDPVVVKVIAADAVAEQKRQIIRLINDSNLTSTQAATFRGLAELTRDAFPHLNVTFKLEDIFLPPGSLALITCSGEGWVSKPFTVQTVSGEPQGAGKYNWSYAVGVYDPTIIDHLRNTQKAVARSTTTANVPQVIDIDVALFDDFNLADSVSASTATAGPYKWGSFTWGFGSWNA